MGDGVCGPCEGIGGIAWGDKNDQIRIPSCSVVALPHEIDQSKLAKPVFPKQYTVKFWEVLIGVKADPFCFAFFPGPDSRGNLATARRRAPTTTTSTGSPPPSSTP